MTTNINTTHDTIENTCSICGCTGEQLFELEIDGETKLVCADCAKANGFVTCEDCGEWVPEGEELSASHGYICESCYENGYFTCERCGDIEPLDELVPVNRAEFWCTSCAGRHANRCIDCGEYFTDGNISLSGDNGVVCDHCNRRDTWHVCYDCDLLVCDDDAVYDDDLEEWLCEACYNERRRDEEDPAFIHNYGYKPEPEFQRRKSETNTALTFGLEVEVDGGSSACTLGRAVAELERPLYMKHDGSLGSQGVEIVTHPATLAFHAYEMRWAAIAKTCVANGYKSHYTETCGLHIHVGREQMGATLPQQDETAAKLVLLVNALWDKLVVFSRRKPTQLDHWAARNNVTYRAMRTYGTDDLSSLTDAQLRESALATVFDGRYQAVNLNNSSTVEFRIFRGSLKRDTILASIQLVNNLTKYAMTHTPTECLNASMSSVIGLEEHNELRAYCEAKGIV